MSRNPHALVQRSKEVKLQHRLLSIIPGALEQRSEAESCAPLMAAVPLLTTQDLCRSYSSYYPRGSRKLSSKALSMCITPSALELKSEAVACAPPIAAGPVLPAPVLLEEGGGGKAGEYLASLLKKGCKSIRVEIEVTDPSNRWLGSKSSVTAEELGCC